MAKLYAAADLGRAAGVTTGTIAYDIGKGRFRAERVGKQFVFTQEQFDAALDHYRRRQAPPGEEPD